MTTQELRVERRNVIVAARDIDKLCDKEERRMSAEERGKFDELMEQANELRQTIEDKERLEKLEAEERDLDGSAGTVSDPDLGDETRTGDDDDTEERSVQLFDRYLLATDQMTVQRAMSAYEEETRDLQADIDTEGGYLVAPKQFINRLIKAIDDQVFIRRSATVIPVPFAQSLGAPSLDTDPDDADWTSEIASGKEDKSMKLGGRELNPHPLAKRLKVSKTLIRKSPMAASLVRDRLAYKQGVAQENAFLTGDGANKPLGVFTASADGIPASRDVSTGNTVSAVTFDGLKNAKYSLKSGYWPGCEWIFHRELVGDIALLKDGNQRYLWQDSVVRGEPDRLLGFPVRMSEFAPKTIGANLYVGILGDFSHYWIAEALTTQIQVATELYLESNQNGYFIRTELDGMPVLGEAFARVQLAAA